MKRKLTAILMAILVLCTLNAGISGYVGASTGYEFNLMTMKTTKLGETDEVKMNFQGIPFYIDCETYLCPWFGFHYGTGIGTFATVLKQDDVSIKPFAPEAPTLYASPYAGLAFKIDCSSKIAIILDAGVAYMAWQLPEKYEGKGTVSEFIHMMNVKGDLALGIYPKSEMAIRIGLKADTPVLTGYQYSAPDSGIRVGDTTATASGVKLVPYIGMGYAYGR